MTDISSEDRRGSGSAWWTAAAITTVSALTSAGFSIAGFFSSATQNDESARIYAGYAVARSVPLAVIVIALVVLRSTRGLAALAVVMGLVQACDAFVGIGQHDISKIFGPAVLAIATFAGVRTLSRGKKR